VSHTFDILAEMEKKGTVFPNLEDGHAEVDSEAHLETEPEIPIANETVAKKYYMKVRIKLKKASTSVTDLADTM
jgi:hypothetical protein